MKKTMIILLFSALTLGGKAQKLIGITGAGIFTSHDTAGKTVGNYEFAEARLMFGENQLRFGVMANLTWVYLEQAKIDPFFYKGQMITLGLSADKWWQSETGNGYFWINSGLCWSYDRGASTTYYSWQKDQIFLIQGGLRSKNLFTEWFGNHLLMASFRAPIQTGQARYSTTPGEIKEGTPYKKGSFRATYENGVKKLTVFAGNKELFFEPTIHLGGGEEAPDNHFFAEYGGGISVGFLQGDGWDRDLFKIKAFQRRDLGGYGPIDSPKPPKLQVEITMNLLNFKK